MAKSIRKIRVDWFAWGRGRQQVGNLDQERTYLVRIELAHRILDARRPMPLPIDRFCATTNLPGCTISQLLIWCLLPI
jgi:hypothetical protein